MAHGDGDAALDYGRRRPPRLFVPVRDPSAVSRWGARMALVQLQAQVPLYEGSMQTVIKALVSSLPLKYAA